MDTIITTINDKIDNQLALRTERRRYHSSLADHLRRDTYAATCRNRVEQFDTIRATLLDLPVTVLDAYIAAADEQRQCDHRVGGYLLLCGGITFGALATAAMLNTYALIGPLLALTVAQLIFGARRVSSDATIYARMATRLRTAPMPPL